MTAEALHDLWLIGVLTMLIGALMSIIFALVVGGAPAETPR